ncbi:MAG: phosphoribosylaminoimidazolesuccinocarboxamide synthase [Cyclobacteriaceae bacterium]
MNAIKETHFSFPGQKAFYRGKVRDVYIFEDKVAMVASDRISAFDVVLPRAIPFKGQILNQIAAHFLDKSRDIVPNWKLDTPDPNVTIGIKCAAYPVEMVIRGYLAGHAWRVYESGARKLCGVTLPDGLRENDRLPHPIITPSTKASEGHDEEISRTEIIRQGIVDQSEYQQLEGYTKALFERGTKLAKEQGLILVDTKYEFGKCDETIYLIDEIHTPDSSRYFYADGYEERQKADVHQKQLSKEFVREWLMTNSFQGKGHQTVPEMTDEVVNSISERYIELFEKVTGQQLVKRNYENCLEAIESSVINSLQSLDLKTY